MAPFAATRATVLAATLAFAAGCGTPGTLPCDHLLADQAETSCPPTIWPCPAKFTSGAANLTVDSSSFKFSGCTHPDVVAAFERYIELTFPHPVRRRLAAAARVGGVFRPIALPFILFFGFCIIFRFFITSL